MEACQVVPSHTERLAEITADIHRLHANVERLGTEALGIAAAATADAILIGERLLEAKQLTQGEFGLYLDESAHLSENAAAAYVKAYAMRKQLTDGHAGRAEITQAYLAIGLLPEAGPGSATTKSGDPFRQFWTFTDKIHDWLGRLDGGGKQRLKLWCEQVLRDLQKPA